MVDNNDELLLKLYCCMLSIFDTMKNEQVLEEVSKELEVTVKDHHLQTSLVEKINDFINTDFQKLV